MAVHAPQQVHRQTVVVAVALAPDFSGPDDRLDRAVDGALHQRVGYFGQRQEQRGAPGAGEGPALGAGAQDIGALHAHPRGPRGAGRHAASCQRIKEDANARGSPAVRAGAAAWADVAACGHRLIEQRFRQYVHDVFHSHVVGFILRRKVWSHKNAPASVLATGVSNTWPTSIFTHRASLTTNIARVGVHCHF